MEKSKLKMNIYTNKILIQQDLRTILIFIVY